MGRRLAECGTWSAYKRHKRRGEEPCEPCRLAAQEQSRKQREKIAKVKLQGFDGETVPISQIVAYGQSVTVDVPAIEDPLESARWRLHRIRAALLVSSPRDVAALAKAEQECMEELTKLAAKSQPQKRSALDELAARRTQRSAGAQG